MSAPGLEFDLESKLLKVLHDSSRRRRSAFTKDNAEVLVFRQVQLGQTIPDLVIVRQTGRIAAGRRVRLSAFESWIVGELLTADELRDTVITQRLFTLLPEVRHALKRLERQGLVEQTASGRYALVSDFSTGYQVLSIEAKLTRWRQALEQAKAYLRFSDQSFVALPASVIAKNKRIVSACRAEGIGLISVTRTGIEVVVKAATREGEIDAREWTWLLAKTGSLRVV